FSDGPATSTVSVQVQDSDGASSNVSAIDVAVSNVAPTVTLSGPGSASEGQTKSYTFSTSDPAADTYTVEATSGGSVGTVSNLVFNRASLPDALPITFSDGPATSTVSVQVQDSDGASSNVSAIDVAVSNVAPTVTLSGPGSASEGQTKSYTF